MRETDWLFLGGAALFVAGAVIVLLAIMRATDSLVAIGVAGMLGALVCLGIGGWRVHTRVDWRRVEAEQRLWESGPLGRTWLKIRRVLSGRK